MKNLHKRAVFCFFVTTVLFSSSPSFSFTDSLSEVYSTSACGLGYVHSSALVGQKMVYNGIPFSGVSQPANLSVSGIPETADIEQAFIWWELTGSDSTGHIVIQNPDMQQDTLVGELIGGMASPYGCWGVGYRVFRTDATHLITGNGDYFASGLPVDSIVSDSTVDVTGVSLFIVYSNKTADFIGHLLVNDGHQMVREETATQSMLMDPVADSSDQATAMMLVSDMQNISGNSLKMNNGAYQGVGEDYWDFEERNTIIIEGQTESEFGIQAPLDCVNLIMVGLYYIYDTDNPSTAIVVAGDSLWVSSTNAIGYQWYMNGDSIQLATSSMFTPIESGSYHVDVELNNGCTSISDTVNFSIATTVSEILRKNYKIYPNPLKTRNLLQIKGALDQFNSIGLYDQIGKLIYQLKIFREDQVLLDMADMKSGVYFLKLEAEDQVFMEKIIKM